MTAIVSPPGRTSFHDSATDAILALIQQLQNTSFDFNFESFFHPYLGALMQLVNQASSLDEVFDPSQWPTTILPAWYGLPDTTTLPQYYTPTQSRGVRVDPMTMTLDVDLNGGPYATYNWELFFHLPLAVAVHLSKNRRFAEAQRWFHYIFDPTTPSTDPNVSGTDRYWKFLGFRTPANPTPDQQGQEYIAHTSIASLIALLNTPPGTAAQANAQAAVLAGYQRIASTPFQPHAVARTRTVSYQYYVVMKYLDNLIAWGDSLFAQDTIETLNEATLLYVMAANLLGARPQQVPPPGTSKPLSYNGMKALWTAAGQTGGVTMSSALVDLEGQFPFNLTPPPPAGGVGGNGSLFGMGNTLYFCVPQNTKLLGYWDTVADRLFKLRNCMNLQGIVQQLPLFDPPIDPGMLIKAMAAGIDVGTAVAGLEQPLGPARALPWVQKAGELANEVRAFGNALLSAFEKGDAEQLALLRQSYEITIQQMAQQTRYLQWQQAQQATEALLRTRASALERYAYYQRLLGLTTAAALPATFTVDHTTVLTEANFDSAFGALVSQYDSDVATLGLSPLALAGSSSPATQSGAAGPGNLYLNANEDSELNTHLPTARDTRLAASTAEALASVLTFIPEFNLNMAFWGMGATSKIIGGSKISDAIKIGAEILRTVSNYEQDQAGLASRTASYQRRADEWTLQNNLAARELMQVGRQILASLIAEQVAHNEYVTAQTQASNAQQMSDFLTGQFSSDTVQAKFTTSALYQWMQGQLTTLYYQYYSLALDTARKAERTMKQELMRPEVDGATYIQPNYWDGAHQGLLAGDALHLDIKRLETAYLDNNAREFELTRHVSLRRLDPLALITLRVTGTCEVSIPEWLYDLDCPGHYMRRVKTVAVSIPSVTGPYQSVSCTLTLLGSTVRTQPTLRQTSYARDANDPSSDPRFVDYPGTGQQIVTSAGSSDTGLFETNLRDERFLPFEGAGAQSSWRLQLPDIASFDYTTIADVVLHVRYTARQGGDALRSPATATLTRSVPPDGSNLFLVFSLRHDFPTEWAARQASPGNAIQLTLTSMMFPYVVQGATLTGAVAGVLYASQGVPGALGVAMRQASATLTVVPAASPPPNWAAHALTQGSVTLSVVDGSSSVLSAATSDDVYLLLPYVATRVPSMSAG